MTDYLSRLAEEICSRVPRASRPDTGEDLELFRIYAVLARAKGPQVQLEDVHDAWCAWMAAREPGHPALVPFAELAPEQRAQDEPFARAIVAVAADLARLDEAEDPEHTDDDGDRV